MLWATVTHLLEIAFERIQIICSESFCREDIQGEKTRMGAVNYVLVLYCCTMFSVHWQESVIQIKWINYFNRVVIQTKFCTILIMESNPLFTAKLKRSIFI